MTTTADLISMEHEGNTVHLQEQGANLSQLHDGEEQIEELGACKGLW